MDARNRMADVIKLRCNVCQDFLKMIIKDNWQQIVYDKARSEIEEKRKYRDKYISAYGKMREIGIENYSIDDMDVTFISEIVHGCKNIAPTTEKTRKSIEKVVEDRNLKDHSSENENDEELYLEGLLALCNLRSFIKCVDNNETTIDDKKRMEYRRSYSKKIEDLKAVLDEERISLIQRQKEIERDIQKILDCGDEEQRHTVWCKISKLYMDRFFNLEKDYEKYYEFIVMASDAGIREAYDGAAYYFFSIKKDYEEGERRLYLLYNSFDVLPAYYSKRIIDMINEYLIQGNDLTSGLEKLINLIIEQGRKVEKSENGLFVCKRMINK